MLDLALASHIDISNVQSDLADLSALRSWKMPIAWRMPMREKQT